MGNKYNWCKDYVVKGRCLNTGGTSSAEKEKDNPKYLLGSVALFLKKKKEREHLHYKVLLKGFDDKMRAGGFV